MSLKKIREKPLNKRITNFIILVAIWFAIAYFINSSYEDSIDKASNLRTLWMLSGLVVAGLWIVYFPKKDKKESK